MKTPMIVVAIRLPKDLLKRIDKRAKSGAYGSTRSEFVRQALEEKLKV